MIGEIAGFQPELVFSVACNRAEIVGDLLTKPSELAVHAGLSHFQNHGCCTPLVYPSGVCKSTKAQ